MICNLVGADSSAIQVVNIIQAIKK
jgi:hypothetical protein